VEEKYPEYVIAIRKSQTEKALIRLSVQGEEVEVCKQITQSIIQILVDLKYMGEQNTTHK
jgi:hypothetical protein